MRKLKLVRHLLRHARRERPRAESVVVQKPAQHVEDEERWADTAHRLVSRCDDVSFRCGAAHSRTPS